MNKITTKNIGKIFVFIGLSFLQGSLIGMHKIDMIAQSFDPQDTELMHLIRSNTDLPTIEKFVAENKAEVNKPNKNGTTPIYLAVKSCNQPLVKLLHNKDAKIATNSREIPFNQAVINCDLPMVQLLLDLKADIDHQDELERTPLHTAVQQAWLSSSQSEKLLSIIAFLIKQKADVTKHDYNNETPLDMPKGLN
jgi:ankyrin repeat protein